MVAHERGPLRFRIQGRPALQRGDQRAGVGAGEGQVERLHADEVELHGQLVAVAATEELQLLLVGEVDLAQEDAAARPPADQCAQVAQVLVRVGQGSAVRARRLQEEGDGVDAEAREPQLQPEAHDLGDLVADLRVGDVEVGLLLVELVQVPLPRLLRERPDAVLLVGEDDLVGGVRRRVGAPDVEVAERRVLGRLRRPEPRVLAGGVVDDQVGDHPHAAVLRRPDHLDEVAVRAQPRVDPVEVGDVVPVVPLAGRVEGHQPQAGDAEVGQVVDPLREPGEVTDPVGVPVHVRLDVQAVDDGVLPPEVGRVGDPHSATAGSGAVTPSCGSTCAPNASRNACCS